MIQSTINVMIIYLNRQIRQYNESVRKALHLRLFRNAFDSMVTLYTVELFFYNRKICCRFLNLNVKCFKTLPPQKKKNTLKMNVK